MSDERLLRVPAAGRQVLVEFPLALKAQPVDLDWLVAAIDEGDAGVLFRRTRCVVGLGRTRLGGSKIAAGTVCRRWMQRTGDVISGRSIDRCGRLRLQPHARQRHGGKRQRPDVTHCGVSLAGESAPIIYGTRAVGECGCHAIRTAASGRLGLGPAALSALPSRNMKVGSQPGMAVNLLISGAISSASPRMALRSTHSTG